MMSWWSGRKEDDQNNHHLHLEASKLKQMKKTPNRRRLGRPTTTASAAAEAAAEEGDAEERSTSAASSPLPPMHHQHHVAETVSGIEVTFSSDDNSNKNSQMLDNDGYGTTAVSLRELLAWRRKVHRAQFRTLQAAATIGSSTGASSSSASHLVFPFSAATNAVGTAASQAASVSVAALIPPDLSSGRHRVQLFAQTLQEQSSSDPSKRQKLSPHDSLLLLESHDVGDEETLVQEEVRNLSYEINALESDHQKMSQRSATLQASIAPKSAVVGPTGPSSLRSGWDAHRLLASDRVPVGGPERARLQEQRGLCLSVSLHNPAAREAFLSRCGSTASALRSATLAATTAMQNQSTVVVTVRPETCRDGGGAATLQHVALLAGSSSPTEAGGFFVSRDGIHGGGAGASATHHKSNRAYYWGHLPDRLFRRMKNAGMDPKHHHACDILYLSTGPMGAYYAEFRSGECWWGSAAEDTEFDALCAEWEVGRVAFGPCSSAVDGRCHEHRATSWIVLGRDGRVAWKNLPSRLHGKLERRLASEVAPAEVSLGAGGTYFVRFADGTVDYSLPVAAARVCRAIEADGSSITSIALHAELPHDFIVRHT